MSARRPPVFKVYRYNSAGDVSAIYVFGGAPDPYDELTATERVAPSVEVIRSSLYIHADDTIHAIKSKIIHTIGVGSISHAELYLFAKTPRHISAKHIYETVAADCTRAITPAMFAQIADNIGAKSTPGYDGSRDASFEDLRKLGLDGDTTVDIKIPIGREFPEGKLNYAFAVSPYKCAHIDAALLAPESALRCVENWVLLSHGNIADNALHLCTADDIFNHYANCAGDQTVLKRIALIYFPYLYGEGVFNAQDLENRKGELLNTNAQHVNDDLLHYFNSVDTMHSVYANRNADANIQSQGVREIAFTFRERRSVTLSLESVFKGIHCSRTYPLITYHPGGGKERRMRLFCDRLADVGKRVPMMKEADIKRTLRPLLRDSGISILYRPESGEQDIMFSINAHGDFHVSRAAAPLIDVEPLMRMLRTAAVPILTQINTMLRDTGHEIECFESLHHEQIHGLLMTYVYSIAGVNNRTASIMQTIPCMSAVFTSGAVDYVANAALVYKRVEDYRHADVSGIDAFILDWYHDTNVVELAHKIAEKFPGWTTASAAAAISACIEKYPAMQERARDNHGFPVQFRIDPVNQNRIDIETSRITNIRYLDVLRIYIETVWLITQSIENVPDAETLTAIAAGSAAAPNVGAAATNVEVFAETAAPAPVPVSAITFAEEEEDEEDDGFAFDDFAAFGDDPAMFGGGGGHIHHGGTKTKTGVSMADDALHKMSITDPSYFFKRLQALEPTLILSRKEGTFDSYSRLCPANLNRQPVIITEEEKANIDTHHPGSYGNALKYGSDPKKPYWYICPRYWCLKTNMSMTEEEVKSGSCGKVIPANSKTPLPGHYVVQLAGRQHFAPDGSFIEHNPGFLKEGLHPTGKCMACCFSGKWDSKMQQTRRQACNPEEYGADTKPKAKETSVQDARYIMSANTRVDKDRWGFLPDPIQSLLRISYTNIMATPHSVRQGYRVLLEYGVDDSIPNKSFIGCVAEMYMHSREPKERPTIDEMARKIAEAITLDDFVTYNNGGLIQIFAPDNAAVENAMRYSNTALYKRIRVDDIAQYRSLLSAISAYEAFIAYILHPTDMVDHTYLWDIVSRPNPRLIVAGCNIVMLRLPNDDSTQNVEVVCPSNAYSSMVYNPDKDTFIVIARSDGTYSMAFHYKETRRRTNPIQVERAMSRSTIPTAMDNILITLYEIAGKGCMPSRGDSATAIAYPYTRNIQTDEMRQILGYYGVKIATQVINYQSKVIGLRVSLPKSGETGVVPVYPSAMDAAEPAVFMDDPIWLPHTETIQFLRKLHAATERKIQCLPIMIVVDDEMAVGVLTETNQFVMFSQPVARAITDMHNIPVIAGPNYFLVEKAIGDEPDPVRRSVSMRLALENNMYTAFRALIRQVINDPVRTAMRRQIIDTIAGRMSYIDKLAEIISVLKTAMTTMVCFAKIDIDMLLSKNTSAITHELPDNACFVSTSPKLCLYISDRHLVSGADNRRVYFVQAADELIRYNRIRYYMLRPRILIHPVGQTYALQKDEILLMQSALSTYLTNLRIVNFNSRVNHVSYDLARSRDETEHRRRVQIDPAAIAAATPSSDTETRIGIDDNVMILSQDACIETVQAVRGNRTTSIWVRTMGTRAQEISFVLSPECSFSPILYILRQTGNMDASVDNIKTRIWNTYTQLGAPLENNIRRLLRAQGKRAIYDKVHRGEVSLEAAIASADYYMSELDVWAMFSGGDIPVIMFYSTSISAASPITWIYLPGPDKIDLIYTHKIYFIRGPARSTIKPNEPSVITLVIPAMELSELGEFARELSSAADARTENFQSLRSMIESREFHVVSKAK